MANVPGTSGPVDYPNRPEGGEQDGPNGSAAPDAIATQLQSSLGSLPGGSNRYPQVAPANVEAQQGAGSGQGGLYPRPDNLGGGAVQKGWRGPSYATGGPDDFQPPAGASSADVFATGGPNGASVNALPTVPKTFTKASTNQG
jgi:hypothetical protein